MTPFLAADVARCRPGCATQRATCGRFLAPLPAVGGSIVDGEKAWPTQPYCGGYMPASECTAPAAGEARRVHPPLLGGGGA